MRVTDHSTSWSRLEALYGPNGGLRRYHGLHIAQTLTKPRTDAMDLGTATHLRVLQPDKFLKRVAEAPDINRNSKAYRNAAAMLEGAELVAIPTGINRRTNVGKAEWKAFQEEHAGKLIVTREELEEAHKAYEALSSVVGKLALKRWQLNLVEAMRDAVFAHEGAAKIIQAPGPAEHEITWQDRTGIQVYAHLDKLCTSDAPDLRGTVIGELKSTVSVRPREVQRAIALGGYHRQAARYIEAVRQEAGLPPWDIWEPETMFPRHVLVFVSSTPPHEVALYELDAKSIALGMTENRHAVDLVAECLRTNDWREDHEVSVRRLSLPPWAFKQDPLEHHAD